MTALANRYDIVFLFDVTNGNPNGDPDAGNLPRMDPETNKGLVSDVSLKRKIRNYTELTKSDQPGYRIYVQEGSILNERHREAYKAVRGDTEKVGKDGKLNPQNDEESRALTKFMCDNFFDVRAFGAVMSTGINAGQVRGPVQVAFASSVETILPLEISITRMAATNEKEKAERQQGDDGDERTENRTMGRKHIVPYGLYRAHMFVNAKLAERTGFDDADLAHLFESLGSMFEHDRSAARGEMSSRRGIAFKHASALQHAVYCLRQAALIHIERQWEENRFTAEGRVLHDVAHDPADRKRGTIRRAMALPLACRRLNLAGVADLVEFRADGDGETAYPVEYKRGKAKLHRADEVQLCAQGLCLEEMTGKTVPEGALFYAETRRRVAVPFDADLRRLTEQTALQFGALFAAGRTPPAVYRADRCRACSLIEVCRPKAGARSALGFRARAIDAVLDGDGLAE